MRTLVAITGIFVLLSMTSMLRYVIMEDAILRQASMTSSLADAHLVYTPGCKIPYIDPWDRSVRHLLRPGLPLQCQGPPALTFTDGPWLRINYTALLYHYNNSLSRCSYERITRVDNGRSDDKFEFTMVDDHFSVDKKVDGEFLRVVCYCLRGRLIYTNFHAIVQDRPKLAKRKRQRYRDHRAKARSKEQFNVLMVGLDTMSRANFIRQMPQTYRYLTDELGGVDMMGLNKVADNTYVNLVPMLVGKLVEELPWDENMADEPFDDYDFIWKRFSRKGYYTLMAEDFPEIAIFNYHKAGFHRQPTDHYLRPYSLAMDSHGSIWNTEHHCVGPKLETEHVLDYMRDFAYKYKEQPHFGFSFITRLTHEDVNTAGAADEPHFRFLRQLAENEALSNTVLIYLSDHGVRFGKFRETYAGRMEERLPAMVVVFPKWFRDKYPNLAANLQLNAQRLTTPFDVRNLLMDVLDFQPDRIAARKIDVRKDRGISWLNEVPTSRGCSTAQILTHWCTCHESTSVRKNSSDVIVAAKSLVAFINQDFIQHNVTRLCHRLTLHSVVDALRIEPNEKVLHFKESYGDVIDRKVTYGDRASPYIEYTLTVQTSPGMAMFEATVRYSELDSAYSIVGDISRINRYGSQSDCVDNFNLKKFCMCR